MKIKVTNKKNHHLRKKKAQRKIYLQRERASVNKQRRELRRIQWARKRRNLQIYIGKVRQRLAGSLKRPDRHDQQALLPDLQVTFINSITFFLLAFWLVYLTSQLLAIFTAGEFSIPAILYSFKTEWPLFKYSPLYSRFNLILIFGIGPLFCFVLAIISYRLFNRLVTKLNLLPVFLFWITFHSLNLVFGAYIAGVITHTGLSYVSSWIFGNVNPGIQEMFLILASSILLIVIGITSVRKLLQMSSSAGIIQPANRIYYILAQLLLPWLLGNLIIAAINYPNFPPEFLSIMITSFLLVFPSIVNYNSASNRLVKIRKPSTTLKISWVTIAILIAFVTFIRLVVYQGIPVN